MVKALFWDCDNTLINTAELHFAKHVAVLKRYGVDLDDRFRPTIYSNNSHQNWDILKQAFELEMPKEKYIEQIDAWYTDNLETLQIRSGAQDVLEMAKAANIRQIVVSNGRKESVFSGLKAKGLSHYFEHILTRDDYQERKPHPEPYLVALEKCGLNAHEVIAIEDDPKGAASSIAADIPTVHIKYKESMPAADGAIYTCFEGADFIQFMTGKLNG